jgi:peptidoglycan biosynthesis protein MviN/MurJ (putative lipid II flippase)
MRRMPKYLRAGFISLALLLLSRFLGLARESALAAALGTTALADAVVVMLTLPDMVTNILATGALGFVLLPWWARQLPQEQARTQRRVAQALLLLGTLLLAWVLVFPGHLASLLAPGLTGAHRDTLLVGLRWAAFSLPASLTAALWYTRLQQERDVVGMYGMNAVHTSVIIAVLLLAAFVLRSASLIDWMGAGLLAALLLRLLWLRWRMAGLQPMVRKPVDPVHGLPTAAIWAWAVLATGLPIALPVLARSLVSNAGDGALATFNYAWKLIELPNLFAIQLVATLAFPAITRAHAEGRDFTLALRSAFVLAWTLACASALALFAGARPLADLLFGWGRMGPEHVAEVARWSAWGAWTLLPQAFIAVLVTVLATLNRMKVAALAYALALLLLLLSGVHEPREVMVALTLALSAVAVIMLVAVRGEALRALPWREIAVPGLLCIALAWLAKSLSFDHQLASLVFSGLIAVVLIACSFLASPVLWALLRR